MKDNQVNSLSFQGDRARYPLKFRPNVLITALSLSRTSRKQNRSQSARLRFSYAVPSCDGRLGHLCHKQQVYGKVKHPQGNHLHQRQGGGG